MAGKADFTPDEWNKLVERESSPELQSQLQSPAVFGAFCRKALQRPRAWRQEPKTPPTREGCDCRAPHVRGPNART